MKDFNKYYKGHLSMSGSALDSYLKRPVSSMTSMVVGTDGSQVDVFSRLIQRRIIFLGDTLYPEVTNIIKAQLLYLAEIGDEDIKMYIDSPGGEVYTSFGVLDTMNFVSPDISTTNTGMAASMGAMLLASGTKGKRSSLLHSRTMIHQPIGGTGYAQASDIEITSKEINKLKKELYMILSKQTGKTIKQIEIDADRDYWLTAKEALKYGIIDKIV